jgi:hypothetical protein
MSVSTAKRYTKLDYDFFIKQFKKEGTCCGRNFGVILDKNLSTPKNKGKAQNQTVIQLKYSATTHHKGKTKHQFVF